MPVMINDFTLWPILQCDRSEQLQWLWSIMYRVITTNWFCVLTLCLINTFPAFFVVSLCILTKSKRSVRVGTMNIRANTYSTFQYDFSLTQTNRKIVTYLYSSPPGIFYYSWIEIWKLLIYRKETLGTPFFWIIKKKLQDLINMWNRIGASIY